MIQNSSIDQYMKYFRAYMTIDDEEDTSCEDNNARCAGSPPSICCMSLWRLESILSIDDLFLICCVEVVFFK